MKLLTHSLPWLLLLVTAGFVFAQTPAAKTGAKQEQPKIVGAGLTYYRYGLHPSQITGNGYVPYQQLGKPLKAPRTVQGISKWEKEEEENAVVLGYIKIEKTGTYGFRTDSFYDRNELWVDGKIVCPYGDGANKGQTADLKEGLVPIVSVGYVNARTEVRVQWIPPGQKEWSDIPNKLLSHEKAD